MDLVGACKEDFEKWLDKNYTDTEIIIPSWDCNVSSYLGNNNLYLFDQLPESCKNALIIDFFDSKGINILISSLDYQNWWWYDVKHFPKTIEGKNMYNSRQEALKEGIKKAVEIYNK